MAFDGVGFAFTVDRHCRAHPMRGPPDGLTTSVHRETVRAPDVSSGLEMCSRLASRLGRVRLRARWLLPGAGTLILR